MQSQINLNVLMDFKSWVAKTVNVKIKKCEEKDYFSSESFSWAFLRLKMKSYFMLVVKKDWQKSDGPQNLECLSHKLCIWSGSQC